ncbi:helix-turn-helix domain-containing protein [Clostridium guangxiense]|uniref:helix-turn-helix domain-containing protein n=1 Tax=Clostridium guangxiense TaxID=1662055 RepID=UPI001E561EFD|nr:helix-turn-helix transcriptional regulator [Clostridium guangxiense]MCD2345768.1 helix-turn-helix domain-containing protein [Clostridium guangxiense]
MNKIKFYRQKQNITITKLSKVSGVAIGYISDLENDKEGIKNPSKSVMISIANALNQKVVNVFFPEEVEREVG